jgi:hypothetical protein
MSTVPGVSISNKTVLQLYLLDSITRAEYIVPFSVRTDRETYGNLSYYGKKKKSFTKARVANCLSITFINNWNHADIKRINVPITLHVTGSLSAV